ncbi:MAG: hypothetical protein BroJett011_44960 [Chloroflexota bacterium]|nr:MAG: hypothetical protein BroJett011_44960 [Chloroflexota bacterium]
MPPFYHIPELLSYWATTQVTDAFALWQEGKNRQTYFYQTPATSSLVGKVQFIPPSYRNSVTGVISTLVQT